MQLLIDFKIAAERAQKVYSKARRVLERGFDIVKLGQIVDDRERKTGEASVSNIQLTVISVSGGSARSPSLVRKNDVVAKRALLGNRVHVDPAQLDSALLGSARLVSLACSLRSKPSLDETRRDETRIRAHGDTTVVGVKDSEG